MDSLDPTWRSADSDQPTSAAHGARILGRRQPASVLRQQLTMVLGKIVVDESGLTGLGNWDMDVREDKPEMIIESVRRQLGLRVEPVRRPVKMLVVELPPR